MLPIGDDNGSRRTFPIITLLLILINAAAFVFELVLGDSFILQWSFIPQRWLENPVGEWPTLFTSMFLHGGWLHIGGNMLYLWVFGDNVEDNFGHIKFLGFYIVCGLAATFSQMALDANSLIPNLGASGAIAGVLGAYLLMFPGRQIKVLIGYFFTRLPALIVLGFWFVLQFFSGVGSIVEPTDQGGVAYLAHIGGFISGFLFTFLLRRKTEEAPEGNIFMR